MHRDNRLGDSALALALLLALPAIWFVLQEQEDFGGFAMGPETTSVFAQAEGRPVHGDNGPSIAAAYDGVARSESPMVLWLGNSQLHGVNQRVGDETCAPQLLHDQLTPQRRLLTASPPNGSPIEHEVIFDYVRKQVRVEELVIAVCFDDLRNEGVRTDLLPLAAGPSSLATTVPVAGATSQESNHVEDSLQEATEQWFNRVLSTYSFLWRQRKQARGDLFVALYRVRNSLLGIDAQTERRMLLPHYHRNLQAVARMLRAAHEAGTRAFVYIVPLRGDVKPPYVPTEYRRFEEDLAAIVRASAAEYRDLADLVPGMYWGMKDATGLDNKAELDFMHFQFPGHVLLAETIGEQISGQRSAAASAQ